MDSTVVVNGDGHPDHEAKNANLLDENKKGIAPIKQEFLITDRVRTVNLEFVSKDDRKRLADDEGQKRGQHTSKKLKGQNKHRAKETRYQSTARLCPFIIHEETCPFGVECRHLHDVSTFTSNRNPDIGPECYVFRTFGRCPHGISCRFGSDHLTSDFKNQINTTLWAEHEGHRTVRNILTKDLQISLRKRTVDFNKAEAVIKSLPKIFEARKARSENTSKNESHCTTGNSDQAVNTEPHDDCNNGSSLLEHSTHGTIEHQCSKTIGAITDEDIVLTRYKEIKQIDFRNKLYLAPLTTVGNLPFRRICKRFGADITCGEMAMAQNLLQGSPSEWALLKRHSSEDIFGVQLCGAHPDQMTRCAQLLNDTVDVDFVDINVGCPIDLVYRKGGGCGLMGRLRKFEQMVYGMRAVLDVPLTAKIRTGIYESKSTAHIIVPQLRDWGVSMVTMHGRSREQRYTKSADWQYIDQCAKLATPMPFFGCGDILSYKDVNLRLRETSVSGIMIARGALIKPWIFTEIREQRDWDISSSERLDILQDYVHFGLEHWGSDTEGVEKTRKFLLEWLSFLYRYIPVGVLERLPQKINERPPYYRGRDDLETLFASPSCSDWIKISEMLLGPVPEGFSFLPKHKANSYS